MSYNDQRARDSSSKLMHNVSEEFSSNAVRLSSRDWMVATVIVAATLSLLPWLQQRMEAFEPSVDYRIPYVLSED